MNSIFITVRTASTRLPQKALLDFDGKMNSIEYVINRQKNSKLYNKIIVCTTCDISDDIIEEICIKQNVLCFRGSTNDKLDRWNNAAKKYNIKNIVTVDGDDPFAEPELVDLAFNQLEINKCDFISCDDIVCGAFTYGFTAIALNEVCKIKDTEDTEMMWTYFIDTHAFKIEQLQNVNKLYFRNDIRMTLDYYDDLIFFKKILEVTKSNNKYLTLYEILETIDNNPEIKNINFYLQTQWKNNQIKNTKLILKNPPKYIGNELKYVEEVLTCNKLTNTRGSWTGKLEKDFAKKMNCKFGIAFNSGTSTLHAALLAAGVKPGDEVISPAITVIMNTAVTIHAGGIPVYIDVKKDTFFMDVDKLEEKITSKTKAIMIVNIYGYMCESEIMRVMKIANKYNIVVIEDNAECFFPSYNLKSHIASYSFEGSKHMSCGEGGIVITNDEILAISMRKIGGHGFSGLTASEGRIKRNPDEFQNPAFKRHDEIGWNYRLSEISSAIAYAQLEYLDDMILMRQQVAQIFIDVIGDCKYLLPQINYSEEYKNSYWALAVLYMGNDLKNISWYDFRKKYIEFGGDGIYSAWSVPYNEPVMQNGNFKKINPNVYKDICYSKGLCQNAEFVQQRLLIFKTNYRSIVLAKYKAYCLKKTIQYFFE